jgi:hypothetical protein
MVKFFAAPLANSICPDKKHKMWPLVQFGSEYWENGPLMW